ncbi:MAG: O-antigen ligase family protein, partial [Bdellovibrionota bacterium]
IFPFFVAVALALSPVLARPARQRSAGVSVLGFVALFATFSRTLWAALPLGLFIALGRYVSRARYAVLVAAAVVAGLVAFQIPQIHGRLLMGGGTSERMTLWRVNWQFFELRPVFGIGWRKAQELTAYYFEEKFPTTWKDLFIGHAHNNLLEMLSGTGIVGTLIWLAWCFLVLRLAWRLSRGRSVRADVAWGLFCAFVVLHLNGLTQANFWEGKVLHQIMWAAGLLIAGAVTAAARSAGD